MDFSIIEGLTEDELTELYDDVQNNNTHLGLACCCRNGFKNYYTSMYRDLCVNYICPVHGSNCTGWMDSYTNWNCDWRC